MAWACLSSTLRTCSASEASSRPNRLASLMMRASSLLTGAVLPMRRPLPARPANGPIEPLPAKKLPPVPHI